MPLRNDEHTYESIRASIRQYQLGEKSPYHQEQKQQLSRWTFALLCAGVISLGSLELRTQEPLSL